MKKWTVPLLILLTVLLLTALGFLPALAGVLQDTGFEKEISCRPLHSIAPYISEKGSALHFTEKLAVMYDSEISVIVPALASMTEQQVRAAVEEGIQPYVDAGIIRIHEAQNFHASPYIAISWQDAQRYFLFWSVTIVWADNDIKYTLTIRVDDETGVFLDMNYYDPDFFTDCSAWNEQYTLPDIFARIWLEQAGLWDYARPLTPGDDAQQIQGAFPDLRTAVYEISDRTGRPISVCFYVANHGEYMMWIEKMSA